MLAPADPSRAAAAALLLFPSVYLTNDEDPPKTHDRLVEWWRELGFVRPQSVEVLASNSAAYRSNPEVRWRPDPNLGWINDGIYSFRNPETRMCPFEERRFLRVKELMAEVEGAA